MHRKNGQFASLKESSKVDTGNWDSSDSIPFPESTWVWIPLLIGFKIYRCRILSFLKGFSQACSITVSCWCWLDPCSFCGYSFDYFEGYVDANIVGLAKSVLQQCVGDQVVQDLFAMLVVSCGQTRWVYLLVKIYRYWCCAIIHIIFFFCFSYANENELEKSILDRWILGIIFGIFQLISHPLLLPKHIHTQNNWQS